MVSTLYSKVVKDEVLMFEMKIEKGYCDILRFYRALTCITIAGIGAIRHIC
jgi:hypothetical protein